MTPFVSRTWVRCAAALAAVALTACGGGGGSGAGKKRAVSVEVVRGAVRTPEAVVTVGQGTTVELDVTSDVGGTVHVHGVDQRVPLRTGAVTKVTFVASITGRWDIEIEDTQLLLVKLEVQP